MAYNKEEENIYRTYISLSRYARFLPEKNRRETWEETVERYVHYFCDEKFGHIFDEKTRSEIYNAIVNVEVLPSMRALMTAGKAIEAENMCAYNCSFVAINYVKAFSEILYILMCGTGVGFSCERQYINELPKVADKFINVNETIVVADSKQGWAESYNALIEYLYQGKIPKIDTSLVRKAGERLKTMGGRASGPGPLVDLFDFTIQKFSSCAGRKLNSVDVHELVCNIAKIVVVGGVRRSALISLSNPSDNRMANIKSGEWYLIKPWLAMANNSAAFTEKPDMNQFIDFWSTLIKSGSGERGIFNVQAAIEKMKLWGREPDGKVGTNPCAEILLLAMQLCNLTELVARPEDTPEVLLKKIRIAAILGTIQSSLTDFKFINEKWKENCEKERLLGVSITGIMDNDFLNKPSEELKNFLIKGRDLAIRTNIEWAKKIGINPSASVTCIKPSGTVSALATRSCKEEQGHLQACSSGIHPSYAKFFKRSVRTSKMDPMCQFLIKSGVPCEDALYDEENTKVFYFPMKSATSITREDISAIDQIKLWLFYSEYWAQHSVSMTCYVREHEWMEVGDFVFKNFSKITGISFLPYDNGIYKQAPFQKITKEEYEEYCKKMPKSIDWSLLKNFEKGELELKFPFACTSGGCDV